jgi:hypothetical protein
MKRKFVYLGLFILGIILTFTITSSMFKVGFDTTIGVMESADKRLAYSLISLFGLIGYFVETIFQKIGENTKKDGNE